MTGRHWTAEEDEIVGTYPINAALKLLRGRSRCALRDRRRRLGNTLVSKFRPKLGWTEAEDDIVRSNTIAGATKILAGRSYSAVAFRRRTIGTAAPRRPWTKAEDRRIRKTAALPLNEAAKHFKDRSRISVRTRRLRLGIHRQRPSGSVWRGSEVKLLQRIWPTCKRSELAAAFPRHPINSVCGTASKLGLRKVAPTFDPSDIIDQIRSRAREDSIATARLSLLCDLGSMLRRRRNPRHDFNQIARAVDFFGGRLVIDWQDQ
jgi:hypothetical protein